MKVKSFILVLSFLFSSIMNAQNQVSLIDLEKTKEYLALTENQYMIVKKKVGEINFILAEDKKIIAGLKERFKNGDEPGFFEKIRVKRGRDNRADKIDELLDEIENQLNTEQKIKYKNLKKPELKMLSKKEIME